MPPPADTQWPNPNWVRVGKHHRIPGAGWAEHLESTAPKDSDGRYVIDADEVERIELEMVEGTNRADVVNRVGNEIIPRKGPMERHFWREMDDYIGASKGQRVKFIYVLYNYSGGVVHGYPVTKDYLKTIRGVNL